MKRLLVAAALASTSLLSTSPIWAQPAAAALGKPLESPDLPAGTVSVKIVDGSPSKPVGGTEVTLFVDGVPRIARTGDDGRAMFKGLAPGAKVQALVVDPDKKELRSEEFALPGVGVKLMLTISAWNPGGGGGGPMMGGGAAGMPNPRQMSGEPRPEQADPAGMFTVRLTYDDFKDAPPVGVEVALVGYHADDTIDMQVVKSDAECCAEMSRIDGRGAPSDFAMTLLPRDGKLERLSSTPAVLDARTGVRLILSGEKRTSNAPIIDDVSKFEKQDSAPPAGKVTISLEGGVEKSAQVSLVELTPGGSKVFGTGKPAAGPPDPAQVQAQEQFQPSPTAPANSVLVTVHGGAESTDAPLEGVTVFVVPQATAAQWNGQVDTTTGADGKALVQVDPKLVGPLVAIVTVNGKTLTTKPFDLSKQGGTLEVEAHWPGESGAQATFDVVPRPGQVFYAETRMHGILYRSMPFQPIPEKGTRASIFIYPRVLVSFNLESRIDDKYLAVSGRFEVSNNAWAPYVGGPDGLLVPLPARFIGGLVAEKDQGDVALVPGEGFRLIRPLAPGNRQFHGAFSLPVEDGGVSWRLDLPFGSFNSSLAIKFVPGMTVSTPPGVNGQNMTIPEGTYYVLPQISIMPKQSMVLSISGLPQPPTWKVWLPRIFGVLVVLLILGGVGAAVLSKRSGEGDRDVRRQKLLDELVELERSQAKGSAKRREQILAELETLWDAA